MSRKYWWGNEFGLKTAVRENANFGVWLGYVGLPQGHPFYGVNDDWTEISVHGGITYAANQLPGMEPDGLWWVGFDTAHFGDLVPALEAMSPEVKARWDQMSKDFVAAMLDIPVSEVELVEVEKEYRDFRYVTAETVYLASQLAISNLGV